MGSNPFADISAQNVIEIQPSREEENFCSISVCWLVTIKADCVDFICRLTKQFLIELFLKISAHETKCILFFASFSLSFSFSFCSLSLSFSFHFHFNIHFQGVPSASYKVVVLEQHLRRQVRHLFPLFKLLWQWFRQKKHLLSCGNYIFDN